MNDSPPDLPSTAGPGPQPQAVPPAPARSLRVPKAPGSRKSGTIVALALVALFVLVATQWWNSHQELSAVRTEMARRLQGSDTLNTETKVIVKSIQETASDLQAKVNVLESKQAESQNQQLALEQLYQELSRNSDDWALAEVEQVLSTASQQLQLAGNVQGALIALQNADNRLSRGDTPRFINVRRAIGRDMERLKSLPLLDLTGIALRLDSVIGQIDSMPLLADEKPVEPAAPPRVTRRQRAADAKAAAGKTSAPAVPASSGNDWLLTAEEKLQNWGAEMWGEVRQLVRVRSVQTPDALLLSPTQAYYARENLKLRLLNARLGLLSRNESAFRSDMIAAQDTIAKYFDTRAKQTQTAQAMLKQIQASNLAIELPTLSESLNAVRNYKVKP